MNGRQPALDAVDKLLAEAENSLVRLFMSAINVGEVFYFLRKNHSEKLAESWRAASRTLPVTIEVPVLDEIWQAAILKSRFPIAYADAFAAAIAQKHDCPLLTGDPDFHRIDHLKVEWIGRR
jgi:uncharacterized protein